MAGNLQYPVLYRSMDARADAAVSNAVATCVADAERLWEPEKFDGPFAIKGFGIAKLRAFDLIAGAGSIVGPYTYMWGFSVNTASTWETWIDGTLSDACYVIITGIYSYAAAPDVEAIKITADGVEYPATDITEMYGWDIATAYLSHPIIVRPEKKIKIMAIAKTAGQKKLGLIGYAVGKRSYLIVEYT